MKIILATAYDINPYKGSESATGWNFVLQIARFNNVIAITRVNNKGEIERFIKDFNIDVSNIEFVYYDLPYYLRFWKKGKRGSSLYFYLWQMFMPIFIIKKRLRFDIAHNVNFHADAFPTFLWVFRRPVVWGPINHHEKIPKEYLYPRKGYLEDRFKWYLKQLIWNFDPFLLLSKLNVRLVLAGNSSVKKRLKMKSDKYKIFSQVGCNVSNTILPQKRSEFAIIIVGRFVPLKGFDIALYAFDEAFKQLSTEEQKDIKLLILGKGPLDSYLKSIQSDLISKDKIKFIEWIDKSEMDVFYEGSNVLMYPSHEGAGMVVVEALSHGLPIICFDNYGPGELVNDSCALKVPYTNYEESISDFADAILQIYRDELLSKRMSVAARELFEAEYTWEKKGLQLQRFYEQIVSKR